jgi:hypothetical protein
MQFDFSENELMLTKMRFNPKLMTENDVFRCNKTILSYFNNNLTKMIGDAP